MGVEVHRDDSQDRGVSPCRLLEFNSPPVRGKGHGRNCTLVVYWNRKSAPDAKPSGFFKQLALYLGPKPRSEFETPAKRLSVAYRLTNDRIKTLIVAPQIVRCPRWEICRYEFGSTIRFMSILKCVLVCGFVQSIDGFLNSAIYLG